MDQRRRKRGLGEEEERGFKGKYEGEEIVGLPASPREMPASLGWLRGAWDGVALTLAVLHIPHPRHRAGTGEHPTAPGVISAMV